MRRSDLRSAGLCGWFSARCGDFSGRILFGVQAGSVLIFFGIAMLFLQHRLSGLRAGFDLQPGFMIFGTGAIGLGVGFLVAAAASIVVSRRLGLMDRGERG